MRFVCDDRFVVVPCLLVAKVQTSVLTYKSCQVFWCLVFLRLIIVVYFPLCVCVVADVGSMLSSHNVVTSTTAMQELDASQELAVNVDMFRVRDLMSDDTQTWSSSLQATWGERFADTTTAEVWLI